MIETDIKQTEIDINTVRKTLYLSKPMMTKLNIIASNSNLKTTDLIKFVLSEYINNKEREN
tara:strand:- start:481 stop:663 length:183 start_codon:yes stop_codon:yes gene_type:complete